MSSIRPIVAGALALLPVLTIPVRAQSGAALMFRGGAEHHGYYDSPAGQSLVGLQWRFPTGGSVISSPAVSGNLVYAGSGDGKLYALSRSTGALRWSYQADSAIASSPAVGHGAVFFTSRSGRIYAVDAVTGRLRWFRATDSLLPFPWGHESGDHYISSPVLAGEMVIVGAGDGGVYALAPATGRVLWRGWTGGRVRSSPAVAGDRVYAGSADGSLYCFDLKTGARRWRFDTDGAHLNSGDFGFDRRTIQSSPSVSGNIVFFGARDGFLYAVSADSGRLRWRFDHQESWIITSPAVHDGRVFAASSDAGFIQALDTAGGRELWHQETGKTTWSSPALTRTSLLIGDRTGEILALDPASGTIRWHFQTGGTIYSSPVVCGSLAFVGSTDGSVYALHLGEGDTTFRAVFYDSAYQKSATFDARRVTSYLVEAGYEQLGEKALADWLEARIADHKPSTLVFGIDYLPKSVATEPLEHSPLRRYLEAGGKVVWPGSPPLLWPRDPATGSAGEYHTMRYQAPGQLLGVSHEQASFDPRGTRATALGVRFGLTGYWKDTWSVPASVVSQVLASDEWGLASSWIKRFGGPAGTGFVRVPGADPRAIYLVAESRPLDAEGSR
jgi:outer membrane protein assembly factor BamB